MGTTKGTAAPELFPGAIRTEPRRTGILPSQEIHELRRNRRIIAIPEIDDSQIQPASIDLRLGKVAYRVQASFLPSRESSTSSKIEDLKLAELDISKPTLLERGAVFVIPVRESLALPYDISGAANPKSTTGRLDIFTRLVTEGGIDSDPEDLQFEQVPKGYKGPLYVEVVSRTFPIILSEGAKLTQLRFVRGKPPAAHDNALERVEQTDRLVYFENGDAPAKAVLSGGLRMSIDLQGGSEGSVVAYKAKRNSPAVDLSKAGAHDAVRYWDAITSTKRLVLDPGDFYILASKERISIPANWAAEMTQFDPASGEFSAHYAGFFDPGFGYGESGEIKGTKAVLEVRAHEVPLLLEDSQVVGRLMYHKMAGFPEKLYGQAIGSSYQQQGLALSKQFRVSEPAQDAKSQKR